jgi:hypothetical protein
MFSRSILLASHPGLRRASSLFLLMSALAANCFGAAPLITTPPASQTIFLGDAATFRVVASGTAPLRYQWFKNGAALSTATGSSLTFATAITDHNAQFTVQVTNATGSVTGGPATLLIDAGNPGAPMTNRLIETTSLWRYHVSKTDLGQAWTGVNYADGSWSSGGGLLYVEDSALPAPKTTALPATAGSLPITCYFRTRFTNTFANAYSLNLVANAVIDDGVLLHLNGAPAAYLGMAGGTPGYATLANRTIGNAAWEGPLDLPTTNLLAGTNVVAAEVHQSTTNSSDIVMGLTLDAIWTPRLRDSNAPALVAVSPAAGSTVATLTQIQVQFTEAVYGVEATDLLITGTSAAGLTVVAPNDYIFTFPQPTAGSVNVTWAAAHGITDRSSNSNAFTAAGFGYVLGSVSSAVQIPFASITQSSDAAPANSAAMAVDGSTTTYSLTANQPGSYWQAHFARPFSLERIEIVNRQAPADAALAGLVLRLFNLDDQIVFESVLSNPGSGSVALIALPTGLQARSLWIGLPGSQTNGAGNFQVGLAEVRAFGQAGLPYGPAPVVPGTNTVRVWQSSDYGAGAYPAANAVDGNTGNFTHTDSLVDSYWMADLGRVVAIDRIEIVNRSSCCDTRLIGLVLRLFDGSSNSMASAALTNPGLGGTWTYAPATAQQARYLRVGLENGQMNGGGNYYVTLAEARVFSGSTNVLTLGSSSPVPVTSNLASFKPSCMLRLDESVPVATNANDDNYSTETKTTQRTVDGYWEVDLGATYALYSLRAIAASGIGYRLTNATIRLYDDAHDTVHWQRVTGTPDAYDCDLNGPWFARYVRVGLEDKQRTDPAGGIEFYIGFREVEIFGRPTNNIGVLSFTASTNQVSVGQAVTLSWAVDDVQRVEIHPDIGSVGAYTGTNGVGSLVVHVTNSTEFVLVATNASGVFSRAVAVQVAAAPLPVRLSEFVSDNKFSLKDGYGEASDWIELRNPGDTPVDLTGWGLSDEPAQPMKWVFPATNLAPHRTLVVFASGQATPFDPAGQLHADFRLERNGGTLLLTASNGVTTVDSVSYAEQETDLAFGRDLEGSWKFLEPTPHAANTAESYVGWLKPPDWSHARGFHETGFTLTLTNNSPGATLLYSLDGSVPSLTYSNGLAIAGTAAVRAQAVRAGYKPTRVQTKTFLFVSDVITSPVMNTAITQDPAYAPRMRPGLLALPSISICVPGQPEYEEKEGSFEVLWPNGSNPVQVNCGISRFGNAWTKFAKRSFRMKCRARYGESKLTVPLFNGFDRGVVATTSFDELDLRSGSQDMNERGFYMAGRFVEDATLDMGSLNPHGRFVHVYVNGVYWGQYDCRELLVEPFLADYLGGGKGDYVVVRGNDNVSDDFVIGAPEPPNLAAWEYARTVANSYDSVRPYVDVSHLIDFMLLWNYGNCESEFRSCGPIGAGSGYKFWIADADGFLRTSALGLNRTVRNGPGGFFGDLVAENSPDFKTLLADRIYRHFFNSGALTPAANDARLAARMQEIHDSLLAECARWGYRTPANWESAAASIRSTLFPTRTSQLFGYLRSAGLYPTFDPPTFNQYGGLVTNGFKPVLSSASGTIYYTLDGSDPRLPGGGISAQARVWAAGAVTITNDFTLNARVRTAAGEWSALAQPRFLLASRRVPTARDLLITEVHYNPAGSDDYEFVELWNASTNLLDLSGVSLSNAVRFIFPSGAALAPGAFVQVVENTTSFAARYQAPGSPYYFASLSVAGQWSGALDNAGETISLFGSNGVELSSVPYKPSGDWSTRADARGSSLELAALPPGDATEAQVKSLVAAGRNWQGSSLYHGSPGRFDTFTTSVRINEVLSHSDVGEDWIELLNVGSQSVALANCTLTDDFDLPARWVFPSNAVILPGEHLVLTASQLGFAFSEAGDDAALLQMSGTNVVRILDAVTLPAAAAQESLGIFQRSDGAFDFTELRANSPAAANALPRVGPVVISEIMFAPPAGKAEFVELANLSGEAVPLYDLARPTNLWQLDGVGSFSFPAGTMLAPCSTLIVCATNPAAFRAQYGVSASVPVLGPWGGVLDDDGETLKLLKPGTPELDGAVPYYRVDHVTYRTNAPWPQTLAGAALERVPVEGYGNDPADWRVTASGGTPGVAATNRPPSLRIEGSLHFSEQSTSSVTVAVADLDAPWQPVTLWATRLPSGSSFDEATGVLTWAPTESQGPGTYLAEFAASDNAGCSPLSASLAVNLDAEEVNLPPTWAPQPDVVFPAGVPLAIPLVASDPDLPAQPLSFQTAGLPAGFHLQTSPLQIVGTGSAAGNSTVTVTVSDGQTPSLQATLQFALQLTPAFALTAQPQPGAMRLSFPALVGQSYRVEFTGSLAEADWQLLQQINNSPTNALTVLDPGAVGQTQRFYRVRWLR